MDVIRSEIRMENNKSCPESVGDISSSLGLDVSNCSGNSKQSDDANSDFFDDFFKPLGAAGMFHRKGRQKILLSDVHSGVGFDAVVEFDSKHLALDKEIRPIRKAPFSLFGCAFGAPIDRDNTELLSIQSEETSSNHKTAIGNPIEFRTPYCGDKLGGNGPRMPDGMKQVSANWRFKGWLPAPENMPEGITFISITRIFEGAEANLDRMLSRISTELVDSHRILKASVQRFCVTFQSFCEKSAPENILYRVSFTAPRFEKEDLDRSMFIFAFIRTALQGSSRSFEYSFFCDKVLMLD